MLAILPKINNILSNHQYFFKKNATLLASLAANLALGISDDNIIQEEDLTNAYNKVDRNIIMRRLKKLLPELVPYVSFLFNTPGHGYYNGVHILISLAGVKQGEPLSTLLFCLANDEILSESSTLRPTTSTIIALADDTSHIGNLNDINTIGDHLEQRLHATGQSLNRTKRVTYLPGATTSTIPNQQLGGYNKFGGIIGDNNTILNNNNEKLRHFLDILDRIQQLSQYFPTSAYYLLTKCAKAEIDSYVNMNAVNINFLQEINKALLHSIHHILKDKTTSWDTLGLKPTQGGIAFKRVTNTKQSITSSLLNDPTNDKYLPLPNNLGFPQDATSEAKLKAREKLLLNTYNRSNKCELQAIPELPQEQLTPPTPREQPPSSPFLITPTFITSVSTYLDPSILIPALRLHLDIDTFTNTTLKSLHNTFHLQSFRTNFNLPTRIQNPLSLSTDHTKDFLAQLRPHCRQAYSFVYATNIVLSKINNPTSSSKPPPPPPVNNNDNNSNNHPPPPPPPPPPPT